MSVRRSTSTSPTPSLPFRRAVRSARKRLGLPDSPEAADGVAAVLVGAQSSFTLEYPVESGNGARWFALSVVPLQRPEGGAVAAHVDVTARRRAEEEARRSRQELAHFLRVSTVGTWGVSDLAVEIGTMTVRGLHKGVKVKLSCPACHVRQTLRAKRAKLALKKLAGKSLRRGQSFTITATKVGFIGSQLKLTVKHYGHTKADRDRAARNPFTAKRLCVPVGSRKPAKKCSARPPNGP